MAVRQFFKVLEGFDRRPEVGDFKVNMKVTRTLLSAVVARTCRYPKALFRGPAERVVEFLTASAAWVQRYRRYRLSAPGAEDAMAGSLRR